MDAARHTSWAAPDQAADPAAEAVMWKTVYFWLGLMLARYLFRRRSIEVDLNRLRNAGL